MKAKFRVLLIDDTEEVLTRLKNIIEQDISVKNLSIRIEVEILKVDLEKRNGSEDYQISEQTITNLGTVCTDSFDYIFSDFGFIGDKDKSEALRARLLDENKGVKKLDIQGFVLQLKDIQSRYTELCNIGSIPNETQNRINPYFFEHKGKLLIYTNSPRPFNNYFESDELQIRKNEVQDIFKKSDKVDFILMHNEFSITPEIDNLFGTVDERKKFYSLLLSKRINSLLQFVGLEHMVESQENLRIKKTDSAFKVLTAWAIGFGAAVAVFGEVLYHFSHKSMTLFMKEYNIEVDTSLWLNIIVTISLIIICWWLFSKWGVKFAQKTENEINNLSQENEK